MIYTQGAVAQMDDTVKHWEHSHSETVTVEKQQLKNLRRPKSTTFDYTGIPPFTGTQNKNREAKTA